MSWPKLKLKPRKYQLEAAEWAYNRGQGVVVLPTGTGKTLVAILWALRLVEEKRAKRVLFIEPTRFLVEQIARYITSVSEKEAKAIHGAIAKGERVKRWKNKIIVATPEILLADWNIVRGEFDAVIVDECHHTTGKDAYKVVMERLAGKTRYKLGLSAFIPWSRRSEIEKTIGPIREWSWTDPSVAPYIPQWIGEVYEATLNDAEKELYDALEYLRTDAPSSLRAALGNAKRWLVRDGALALRDSMNRSTMLAEALRKIRHLIENPEIRPSHKLEPYYRILADHEGFNKAIVFIDRVIVAKYVCEDSNSKGYTCTLIRGRMRREELQQVISKAKKPDTKIVVSTSAGEEGIDLPEADLLIVWSITASPLRFIQRHGRILRAKEKRGPPKYVAYIVTLDTVDVDSFVDAIEAAKKIGVDVPLDRETVEYLWKHTTRSKIISILEGNPMTLDSLAQITGIPPQRLRADMQKLMRQGYIVYIHTPIGKVYAYSGDIELLEEQYAEYLKPLKHVTAKIKYATSFQEKWERAIKGDYRTVYTKLRGILLKKGPLTRIIASLQVEEKGIIRQVNLAYTFLVDNEDKLRLVLNNIYSAPNIVRKATMQEYLYLEE